MMNRNYILTKSKFLLGFNCSKALWLSTHQPEDAQPVSLGLKKILEQGILVGEYARKQFPDGKLVSAGHNNLSESLIETMKLVREKQIIFEGVFLFDDILIKADILKPLHDNKWELIEVKQSTRAKDENIPDLAIQKYVIQNYGINISSTKLMLINNKCAHPDLSNLFYFEDISDQVNEMAETLPGKIHELKNILIKKDVPLAELGISCNPKAKNCVYADFCWKEYDSPTIFDIPRLTLRKRNDLLNQGIILIEDIPDDYVFSKNQEEFLEMVRTNKPLINKNSIKDELQYLTYPFYFLDFETDNPAIPRFNGLHPYDVIPFQFSCHKLDENGNVEHFEYLHTDKTDPRKPFIENLLNCLGTKGSIIVYNASFEGSRLRNLIRWFPELEIQIMDLLERFWDQLMIFRKYYKHPGFESSNSIKNVLPVLVPELNYNQLEVRKGDEAQYIWNTLIKEKDDIKKEKMIKDLKEYCKMDTLAMLEIHKKLLMLH